MVAVLCSFSFSSTYAQNRVSKRFPAGKNLRVELKNISGTITVESWNRDEIKITAVLEAPTANVTPKLMGECVSIDVMGENRGRGDVGDVNFKIQVPQDSSVDIETRRGDITVSNIRGGLVRAHISTEGDITLTRHQRDAGAGPKYYRKHLSSMEVFREGAHTSFSRQRETSACVFPYDSAFRLVAASPTKKIALGEFWNNGFKNLGDGQKVRRRRGRWSFIGNGDNLSGQYYVYPSLIRRLKFYSLDADDS